MSPHHYKLNRGNRVAKGKGRKSANYSLFETFEMSSSANKNWPMFFEVFLPEHSSESLRIPDAFLEHLDHKLPKKVVLRNHHGNLWPVDVAEIEDCHFFQEGWSKLASDNSLRVGEFLTFEYKGGHRFDFMILATTGCKKEQIRTFQSNEHPLREEINLPAQEEEVEGGGRGRRAENRKRDRDETESSVGSKIHSSRGKNYSVNGYCEKKLPKGIKEFLPSNDNPFFITKLREKNSSEVLIPHQVREDFGLKFSKSIDVQDPLGRFWKGRIDSWKDGRIWIKGGWRQLCEWNKVGFDDWLICEFLPSCKPTCEIIRVQIIRPEDLKRQTHS